MHAEKRTPAETQPYGAPRLRVYGLLEESTRTRTQTNSMNDAFGPA